MQNCKTEVKYKEEPPNDRQQMDNDPQPGPSGLHRDALITTVKRNRAIDSSDEESCDGDHLNGSGPWIGRMNGPMAVVPKLEIESPTGHETAPINEYHANCSRESHIENGSGDLLSAPDLQLDCLSDSSDEYVPPPAPIAPDLVKIEPQSPPHIDLTRDTDDEEFVRLPTSRLRLDNNQHHYHTIRSPNSSRIFRPKQRHTGYAYTEESVSYLANIIEFCILTYFRFLFCSLLFKVATAKWKRSIARQFCTQYGRQPVPCDIAFTCSNAESGTAPATIAYQLLSQQ